ncbi:MAG TPA: PH domain-containing protein, partial [Flavisolibacter sp.]
MTTYKSKIGPELLIPISILLVGTGILMAYERAWLGLAVVLLVVAFITHMFVTTYYHIDNRTLKIRCGFFYDKTINIDTIEEVKKTRSAVSSPAASLDRIMIRYNKTDTVIISPGNKETFMSHLTRINP